MNVLDKVKVVDLSHALAGPFCTMLLADLGADVVKVEHPHGDHFRPALGGAYNAAVNRNKRGVSVDLKREAGKEVVRRLIKRSDILVESFTPGTIDRLGFGYQAVRELNPGLIFCSISGFGQTGPYRSLPGYDVVAQAMSGIMMCTGQADGPPVRIGPSLIDMGAGMYAAIGILGALLEKRKSGQGRRIDVSLLDTALSWMAPFVARYSMTGELPQRIGSALASFSPYQVFQASDGYVFIGASTERFWRSLCQVLGIEHLMDDPRFSDMQARIQNRDELTVLIEKALDKFKVSQIVDKLRQAGVPCGPVMNVKEIMEDPHVAQRGILRPLEHPEYGWLTQVRTPIVCSGKMPDIRSASPLLGQHSREVLDELGYSPQEISRLIVEGTVISADTPG